MWRVKNTSLLEQKDLAVIVEDVMEYIKNNGPPKKGQSKNVGAVILIFGVH